MQLSNVQEYVPSPITQDDQEALGLYETASEIMEQGNERLNAFVRKIERHGHNGGREEVEFLYRIKGYRDLLTRMHREFNDLRQGIEDEVG